MWALQLGRNFLGVSSGRGCNIRLSGFVALSLTVGVTTGCSRVFTDYVRSLTPLTSTSTTSGQPPSGNPGTGGSTVKPSAVSIAVSATQAILAYASSQPCQVQVSTQSSLSPLVHDVDPSLFPGSNLDNREGSSAAGTTHVLVIGRRTGQKGADGKYYSRALQAATPHYYQITCGTQVTSGGFTTSNIPTGTSFFDTLPTDSTQPGSYAWPTVSATDRSEEFVDPHTGMLLRHLSLPAETVNTAANLFEFFPALTCGTTTITDQNGNSGFRCMIDGRLYFINNSTGDVMCIGAASPGPDMVVDGHGAGEGCTSISPTFDPSDPNIYYCMTQEIETVNGVLGYENRSIFSAEFLGPNAPVPGGVIPDCSTNGQVQPCMQFTNLTPGSLGKGLLGMQTALAPSFAAFGGNLTCQIMGIQNHYLTIYCNRSNQDTYAFYMAFDVGDHNPQHTGMSGGPNLIAAMNTYSVAPIRWCSNHDMGVIGNSNWINGASNSLQGAGVLGGGPYESTITSGALGTSLIDCPSNPYVSGAQCSTITVSGEPEVPDPVAGDSGFLQAAIVGDYFKIYDPNGSSFPGAYAEIVRLIAKNGTSWTIQRAVPNGPESIAPQSYPASSILQASCGTGGQIWWWDFVDDPTGANITGSTLVTDTNATGAHNSFSPTVGYIDTMQMPTPYFDQIFYHDRAGPVPTFIDANPTYTPTNPAFHGIAGNGGTNSVDSHPATSLTGAMFFDGRPWDGGVLGATTPMGTEISPNIYHFTSNAYGGSGTQLSLHPTTMATIATCGPNPLVDVSGPASSITAAPNFSYCIAKNPGECAAGASVGDVFVSCTGVSQAQCVYDGIPNPGWNIQDICVSDNGAFTQSLTQTGVGPSDYVGTMTRILTQGFSVYRRQDVFWQTNAIPDNSWIFFRVPQDAPPGPGSMFGNAAGQWFIGKLPPYPGADTTGRTDYYSLPIQLTAPSGSAKAVAQFGYEEDGAASQYFCTSRREACVIGSSPDFGYASDQVPGIPCASGQACNLTIPTIPGRVVYINVQFMDGAGQVVSSIPLVGMGEAPYTVLGY